MQGKRGAGPPGFLFQVPQPTAAGCGSEPRDSMHSSGFLCIRLLPEITGFSHTGLQGRVWTCPPPPPAGGLAQLCPAQLIHHRAEPRRPARGCSGPARRQWEKANAPRCFQVVQEGPSVYRSCLFIRGDSKTKKPARCPCAYPRDSRTTLVCSREPSVGPDNEFRSPEWGNLTAQRWDFPGLAVPHRGQQA